MRRFDFFRPGTLAEAVSLLREHGDGGEILAGGTAAAIANAVSDATGVRLSEMPATPERVLRALGKIGDGS